MYQSLNSTGLFLINSIFDLYLMVLCVRLILAYSRANYFNPITRFIIIMTQPVIAPLRRYIPNYHGIEYSTLTFIIALAMIKYLIISALFFSIPSAGILFVGAMLSSLKLILSIFFYAILFGAILSFLTPSSTPLSEVLSQIASPILRPFQKLIPPVGGFDISPIPALLILQVLMRAL